MTIMMRNLATVLVILGMASAAPAAALLYTVDNPTPALNDDFGKALALSGNYLVVSAAGDDTLSSNAGQTYLFDATTHSLLQTLNNPNPASPVIPADTFGGSIGMSGNYVVVGTPYEDGVGSQQANCGIAYVFDATNGALVHTLSNPAPSFGAAFGSAVAVSGTKAVIGAGFPNTTGAGDLSGDAYVFDVATGLRDWTLASPTSSSEDRFGTSVAIDGNYVAVGSYNNDTGATNAGAVFLYDATTGGLLRTIFDPNPATSEQFGSRVAVSGNRVLVTSPGDHTAAFGGTAYLFDITTGALLQTFTHPEPEAGDAFANSTLGNNVALSGDKVLIGAFDHTGIVGSGTGFGSAYLFDAATGAMLSSFNDSTPANQDRFAYAVAMSSNLIAASRVTAPEVVRVFSNANPVLLGDYNHDGTVDAADYIVWRTGTSVTSTQENYDIWRSHFGQSIGSGFTSSNGNVPEPRTSFLTLLIAVMLASSTRRRQVAKNSC
jgi:FG-GAP repeat